MNDQNGLSWTLYVCPGCGAGPFDRDPAEEHAALDCDPDTWPWEPTEVVPVAHVRRLRQAAQDVLARPRSARARLALLTVLYPDERERARALLDA